MLFSHAMLYVFKAPSDMKLQVMEDRGGELRKAKERYRSVSLPARPASRQGGLGGGGCIRSSRMVIVQFCSNA